MLLGLPRADAKSLVNGEVFTGPSGLECQLVAEIVEGQPKSARPTVLLGLKAYDLAGDEVHLLLTLQARLLSGGLWYLGASPKGDLLITALHPYYTSQEVAAAFDVANFTAWSTLQLMLEAMPLSEGNFNREKMQ